MSNSACAFSTSPVSPIASSVPQAAPAGRTRAHRSLALPRKRMALRHALEESAAPPRIGVEFGQTCGHRHAGCWKACATSRRIAPSRHRRRAAFLRLPDFAHGSARRSSEFDIEPAAGVEMATFGPQPGDFLRPVGPPSPEISRWKSQYRHAHTCWPKIATARSPRSRQVAATSTTCCFLLLVPRAAGATGGDRAVADFGPARVGVRY